MELTRSDFLSGAGATCGALASTAGCTMGPSRQGGVTSAAVDHDPNLVAFLSDIHLLDNTARWKDGPAQSTIVLPQLVSEILALRPLPSGGFWGDIGYALFRTFEDRAELTFRQTDFYFNRRWQDRPRPKNWRERVRMHDGRTVAFWYDKPGNFYGG